MAAVDLKSLVGKLNDPCRQALEGAAGLTLSRSQYNVEIEHWLLKLVEVPDGDVAAILRHYDVDIGRLAAALNRVLDRLKTGNARAPGLSPGVIALAREAWVLASVQYGAGRVRSGHILAALLSDEQLSGQAREASAEFARIQPDLLRRELATLTEGTAEAARAESAPAADGAPAAPRAGGPTPSLDQFTIDLTAQAAAGKIDPVLGRDPEIRQVVDILTRRRQNNPILTGEAGVGKTAVVEGFALRIAQGDVPPALQNVSVRSLDLGLLQAGAGIKGEFENRLKAVIEEVKGSAKPIILFIDEAHTMIGAGGQAGQNDAANLLKPALARGELRTIAATTWAEYKKYFERDAALTRRFQVVKVEEPGEAAAVSMMRGLVATLEKHHGVRILDEAVVDAVRLSNRYVPARQLPDKSVSVLDTACARVAMSLSATPASVEDRRRRLDLIDTETRVLTREMASGAPHDEQVATLAAERERVSAELVALEERWAKERDLIDRMRTLRDELEAPPAEGAPDTQSVGTDVMTGKRAELEALNAELLALQGEDPLLQPCVNGQAVAEIVSGWTGIPLGRIVSSELRAILSLKERMKERIIGQDHALETVAQAILTSRAKLTDPRKPVGVFMMVGTSGVGKTETALALADLLYGGEQNLTVINMSEFKEEHKVSMLVGSPPGYVGYGEGGVLTEAVRRRPYSVVLFDEMEKAHPGVQDVFYQVFDKGMLRDGEGRDIDFKNTVIIMTSNVGTDLIAKLCADPDTMPDDAGLAEALRPELLKIFKPAFLGRVTVVPYFPLGDDIIRRIVKLQLERIRGRIEANYRAAFAYDESLVELIASRCRESESGARNVESVLTRGILPELSSRFLDRMAQGDAIITVRLGATADGEVSYAINE